MYIPSDGLSFQYNIYSFVQYLHAQHQVATILKIKKFHLKVDNTTCVHLKIIMIVFSSQVTCLKSTGDFVEQVSILEQWEFF